MDQCSAHRDLLHKTLLDQTTMSASEHALGTHHYCCWLWTDYGNLSIQQSDGKCSYIESLSIHLEHQSCSHKHSDRLANLLQKQSLCSDLNRPEHAPRRRLKRNSIECFLSPA